MKTLLKHLLGKYIIAALWHKPKAMLAALLAGFPARHFTVIAVAGTKGKTSTAYYISHLLDKSGIPNALFSTAALKVDGDESLNTLKLTTPTPLFFQNFLRRALQQGCTHLVVEVSSHALVQERLWGVPFHIVVLTNLAPDHLEYHADAEEYQQTHNLLITKNLRHLILNGDDQHLAVFESITVPKTIFHRSDTLSKNIQRLISLRGEFNLSNALCAYHACLALGIPAQTLDKGTRTLHGAPGRMEQIPNSRGIDILVDYAHSVESLETFFSAIRSTCSGKLIAVFGACGERDPKQRPQMGRVLDRFADTIIVTNDDPYSEDPQTIADQLLSGIMQKKQGSTLFTILDRREAIQKALSLAQKGDCVCVLGKGAEQWQVFKSKKIPWDDRRVVTEELSHAQK